MRWYELAEDWQQFTALVRKKWDKITDADLMTFSGQSEQLADMLERKYGHTREQTDKEIDEFSHKV